MWRARAPAAGAGNGLRRERDIGWGGHSGGPFRRALHAATVRVARFALAPSPFADPPQRSGGRRERFLAPAAARAEKTLARRREMPQSWWGMPQLRPPARHFTSKTPRIGTSLPHFTTELPRIGTSLRHFTTELPRFGTSLLHPNRYLPRPRARLRTVTACRRSGRGRSAQKVRVGRGRAGSGRRRRTAAAPRRWLRVRRVAMPRK